MHCFSAPTPQFNRGFTLMELMVVIALIAILTSIGLPAYQHYTQKAALTDLLQAMVPYKTAIELCAFETGTDQHVLSRECIQGKNGIPDGYTAQEDSLGYTKTISVAAGGVITITGQKTLSGLTVTLTPTLENSGAVRWSRSCHSDNNALTIHCQNAFKFHSSQPSS